METATFSQSRWVSCPEEYSAPVVLKKNHACPRGTLELNLSYSDGKVQTHCRTTGMTVEVKS